MSSQGNAALPADVPTRISLRLESLATGGEAVGRRDGMVVFVPFGLPGERVEVEIVERRRAFLRGQIVALAEESPQRVAPPCRHFGVCGGCAWQHVDYAAQVQAKERIVREQMARIARQPDAEVRPCIASPKAYGWRNHARLAVNAQGRPGYRAASSHEVVPVEECPILEESLQERLQALRSAALDAGEIELRVPMQPIEVAGRAYTVPYPAFFQANTQVAALLVDTVLAALDLRPGDAVLDLYCGVGLFTLPIAERAARVIGVEVADAAVRGARLNLRAFPHARVIEADVEQALGEERITSQLWDAVVLDPPRRGVARPALERLAALRPARVVYVSCDPATLARDVAILCAHGYALRYAQPLDMFPQTAHVETVALFTSQADAQP